MTHSDNNQESKSDTPVITEETVDNVYEDIDNNDQDTDTIASRVEALKLHQEITKNLEYSSSLKFMSTQKDEDGELIEDETYSETLEPDGDGYNTGLLLGYPDDPLHKYILRRDYFPSKAGGRPAWLNPKNIPETKCKYCSSPMNFLMQVYSPIPDEDPNSEACFHRTMFVFICSDNDCCLINNSVSVFRSQLPLENEYYSSNPPAQLEEDDEFTRHTEVLPYTGVDTCEICCAKSIASINNLHYCSQQHKEMLIKAFDSTDTDSYLDQCVYPVNEIYVEEEIVESDFVAPTDLEAQAITNYDNERKEMTTKERDEDDQAFDSMFGEGNEGGFVKKDSNTDTLFIDFQARMSYNPNQILRYIPYNRRIASLSGKPFPTPFWTSVNRRIHTSNVPPCNKCGEKRIFEFQILPQLIYYFEHLSREATELTGIERQWKEMDFGTIVVFTCSKNCDAKEEYIEEFGYVQPPNV